ncbi:MAG: DsbC family protein [Burkholderiaceae bacterium]
MMIQRRHFLSSMLAGGLGLTACSRQESASVAKGPRRSPSVEILAAEAKGFTVGAMMNANTVYVMFDAQCPHCAHLWQAAIPLQKKAKFIWIPVGLLNTASSSQGVALLSAADPAQSMTEHEASMLAGSGGLSASANVAPSMEAALKANTRLFNELGVESVPFIIARNPRTGLTVTNSGSMGTAALAALIGVDWP